MPCTCSSTVLSLECTKILFYRDHYWLQTTELLFQKMPNFTTNQKFLENFVLIFAKDNTDCFLFCNLGSTLLKTEDLLKFVFFFEVAYLKIRSCAQCYFIWRFFITNFTLLVFLVIFCPNLLFFEKVTLYFVTDSDPDRTEFWIRFLIPTYIQQS